MKIIIRNTNIPEFIDDLMDEFPQVNFVASENPDEILQEIDDFNHLSAYESMFQDGEHQTEKEQFLTNRCMGKRVY